MLLHYGHQLRALDLEMRVTYIPQQTGLADINLCRNTINCPYRLINMSTALQSLAGSKADRDATQLRSRTVICGEKHIKTGHIPAERQEIDSEERVLN